MVKFRLKEDESTEISIAGDEVEEIVPDADFRYSLLILTSGDKHFVCGTKEEIEEHLKDSGPASKKG